jgi:hypothetical protein
MLCEIANLRDLTLVMKKFLMIIKLVPQPTLAVEEAPCSLAINLILTWRINICEN